MLSGEPSVLECHLNEENLNEEQEERMGWGGGKVTACGEMCVATLNSRKDAALEELRESNCDSGQRCLASEGESGSN